MNHLVLSDIYTAFSNQNANINLALKRYLNPSKKQILDRFKEVFMNLSDKEINAELVYRIEVFEENLKTRLPVLKQFKALIVKNIENFKSSNQKLGSFITTISHFEDLFLNFTKDISAYNKSDSNDPFAENYGSKFGIFDELLQQQE